MLVVPLPFKEVLKCGTRAKHHQNCTILNNGNSIGLDAASNRRANPIFVVDIAVDSINILSHTYRLIILSSETLGRLTLPVQANYMSKPRVLLSVS